MGRLMLGVLLLSLAACSTSSPAPSGGEPSPPATGIAPAISSPAASQLASPATVACPNPDGGPANRCLGPLAAGTYTTSVFQPALTCSVPAAWGNDEDLPGQVLLLPPGAMLGDPDTDYIGVYRPVGAPLDDCSSERDPAVVSTAAAYLDWLREQPALEVSPPTPVQAGPLTGAMVDVELSPDATNTCSDPDQGIDRFVEVMIGLSPADFSASVTPMGGMRLSLFDVDDRLLAVMATHEHDVGGGEQAFLAAAQDVIDTFSFRTDATSASS
jgi:hypothetical protein